MKSYQALMAMEPGVDTGVGKQVMTWTRAVPGDEQVSPSAHVCPGPLASRHQKWAEDLVQQLHRVPKGEKKTPTSRSRIMMITEYIYTGIQYMCSGCNVCT